MIKFMVCQKIQSEDGEFYNVITGASSGYYEVDDDVDFEKFPIPNGYIKIELSPSFDMDKFDTDHFDATDKLYKKAFTAGVKGPGSKERNTKDITEINYRVYLKDEKGKVLRDEDDNPRFDRKNLDVELRANRSRKKLRKTGKDRVVEV